MHCVNTDQLTRWRYFNNECILINTHKLYIAPAEQYLIGTGNSLMAICTLFICVWPFSDLQNWNVYLQKNVARLRDIELATGLQFLTSLERNAAARLRTYLPEKIWETRLVEAWDDVTSCPNEAGCTTEYWRSLIPHTIMSTCHL